MYMLTFRRNLLHLCSDLMYRWLFVNAATHLILIYNVLRKGKKKVRMSLCKPRKRDVEEWLHQFLSTALCGGEWSGVRQGRYTFRGVGDPSINQEPHTHLHTHTHIHIHTYMAVQRSLGGLCLRCCLSYHVTFVPLTIICSMYIK